MNSETIEQKLKKHSLSDLRLIQKMGYVYLSANKAAKLNEYVNQEIESRLNKIIE